MLLTINSSTIFTCQSHVVKLPNNFIYKTTGTNLFLANPIYSKKLPAVAFASPLRALPGKSDEQKWTYEGLITESLPDLFFRVRLNKDDGEDNGEPILGYLCGKMKQNHIRLLVGDKVKVELSRYDSARGRIVYRQDSRERSDKPPRKDKKKGSQYNKKK